MCLEPVITGVLKRKVSKEDTRLVVNLSYQRAVFARKPADVCVLCIFFFFEGKAAIFTP